MRKIIMWVLVLVLLLPSIMAAKIIEPQISTTGLHIQTIKTLYIPANTDFVWHFHVVNSTNYPVNSATTDCFVHVYGLDGECPNQDYKDKYDYWTLKNNITDM